MTTEILAKIMGIIAKGGERVIVVDPKSGAPFVLMGLEEYEKMVEAKQGVAGVSGKMTSSASLTPPQGPGMIDPDLALMAEAVKGAGDWGGDEEKEEDRYYMEPAE